MKKKPNRVQVPLRVPEKTLESIDEEAAEMGLSRNAFILHILRGWRDLSREKEGTQD